MASDRTVRPHRPRRAGAIEGVKPRAVNPSQPNGVSRALCEYSVTALKFKTMKFTLTIYAYYCMITQPRNQTFAEPCTEMAKKVCLYVA